MGDCNRCGKCCFYPVSKNPDGSLLMKACKNLVQLSSGATLCRIYKKRLGAIIGKDNLGRIYRCTMYNSLNAEIEGCPMNIGSKPLVNVEIKGKLAIRSNVDKSIKETIIPIITQ